MTVNEEQLLQIIRTLRAGYIGMEEKAKEMKKLADVFSKIELENGNPKTDEDTNQPMTQTRRDEIYDKCIQEAKRLLDQ